MAYSKKIETPEGTGSEIRLRVLEGGRARPPGDGSALQGGGDDASEDLLRRYAGGDALALGVLYERHSEQVERYVRSELAKEWAWIRLRTEEACSTVWYTIASTAANFRGESLFMTWAIGIAENVLKTELRNWKGTKDRRPPKPLPEGDAEPQAPARPDPIEQEELERDVPRAKADLPELQRQTVELRVEGLTWEKMANSLHMPASTVRGHFDRAASSLRASLRNHTQASGPAPESRVAHEGKAVVEPRGVSRLEDPCGDTSRQSPAGAPQTPPPIDK